MITTKSTITTINSNRTNNNDKNQTIITIAMKIIIITTIKTTTGPGLVSVIFSDKGPDSLLPKISFLKSKYPLILFLLFLIFRTIIFRFC